MNEDDFYGIEPGTVPGYAGLGDTFLATQDLPEQTSRTMMAFMDELRAMHDENPLAFEACVLHVAAVIDARNDERAADPREQS
jgi:hypothetical protein